MASFEQHLIVTKVVIGITLVPISASGLLGLEESFIALCIGVIGGLLPDSDSSSSTPIQILFKLVSIFFPLAVLILLADNIPLLYMLGIWLASSIVLSYLVFGIFFKMVVHRGVVHTIPMGVLTGQLTMALSYYIFDLSITESTIFGYFMIFGFLLHLILDEIASLNLLGAKFKKSLGTALKLYDSRNKIGTLSIYCFISILFYFMPLDFDIFLKIIHALGNMTLI